MYCSHFRHFCKEYVSQPEHVEKERIVIGRWGNIHREILEHRVIGALYQKKIQDDFLTLQVEDDGQGFDPQILQATDMPVKSIGLWGIQERVNILKGEFKMQTAPGEGATLTIRVPITQMEMANG